MIKSNQIGPPPSKPSLIQAKTITFLIKNKRETKISTIKQNTHVINNPHQTTCINKNTNRNQKQSIITLKLNNKIQNQKPTSILKGHHDLQYNQDLPVGTSDPPTKIPTFKTKPNTL